MYFFTDRVIGVNQDKLQQKVNSKKLIFMKQIHGDNIEVIDKNSTIKECDAMITIDKNIALCVVVADCIPVILIDKTRGAVGVAHAGRIGSYRGIIKKTIDKMCEEFTCNIENIHVIFGPSIKKCCYEVGDEVISGFEEFTCKRDGKIYLDLIALNKKELNHVEVSSTCTCCDENYFSYRRDGTKERFCGVVYV
ncbi:MAG: peptidoglycan editing factor PgeF [Sulfurospirillum sp.]|nr:peptidoglycan editing factor PgeF [Sulfurospirillum sp.]MBL0702848.1 peptidoglycan editing factor PgeF [Sulfurospirillum sp.]